MADTTTRYAFPYQESTDAPNGPILGQDLAEAVEASLGIVDDRVTAVEADVLTLEARLPRTVVKANATARANTATLAADSGTGQVLASIPLAVGTYDIELIAFFTVANVTPKLKTRWGFTGTASDAMRLCHGPASDNVDGPETASDATVRGYAALSQDAVYNASTSSAYSAILEVACGLQVTVAGNLSLQWAQQTSNASNVTVQAGSAFRIHRTA